MSKTTIVFVSLVISLIAFVPVHAEWSPKVYNAIKWTERNQGQLTIAYTTMEGITRVPLVYNGGIDRNASGDYSNREMELFAQWVRGQLPSDYCGPMVIDYEQPWRKSLSGRILSPERLQEILSVYIDGIHFAQGILPSAQWGYWGMPLLRNTGKGWQEQNLSLQPLTSQCTALYPDIYDDNRGNEQCKRTKTHISKVLELAQGQIPVYVFVSPRFAGEGGNHSHFVPDDVFLRRVNAAMQAVWVDESGLQHRIQGVILWDTYSFSTETEWEALDQKHKYYFELLQALVNAWKKSMGEVQVDVGLSGASVCEYGLPEPRNSGDTLAVNVTIDAQRRDERMKEFPQVENERIPSGRVPNNRTIE